MDLSWSQCSSSRYESGWTMYLDQSSWSNNNRHHQYESRGEEDDKEHVDLSMVSDASSGPPHYIVDDEDGGGGDNYYGHQVTKNKTKINECYYNRGQNYCYLDDTASSPALTNGKNNTSKNQVQGMPQDFTGKKTKGKAAVKMHFGFRQPSFPEKTASKEPRPYFVRLRIESFTRMTRWVPGKKMDLDI